MSVLSDVKAVRVTATGDTGSGGTRLKGIHVSAAAGGGRLTITDGNGGATIFDADFTASADAELEIPGNGILARDGLWVSAITNITSVTLFYG